jgi:hypothetical protein
MAHTGQILFPEEITTAGIAGKPYPTHDIQRRTLAEDRVFNRENGRQSVATRKPRQPGSVSAGYVREPFFSASIRE